MANPLCGAAAYTSAASARANRRARFAVLETERLHLRLFKRTDLGSLTTIFAVPQVVRYLGNGQPVSPGETEVALRSILRHWRAHGFGRWAVVHKGRGELIGYGGLRNLEGMPELVYLLARDYWGRGLATELARACLRLSFTTRRFPRIVAITQPDNLASRRVLEKLGMTHEGAARYFGIDVAQYSLSSNAYARQPHA